MRALWAIAIGLLLVSDASAQFRPGGGQTGGQGAPSGQAPGGGFGKGGFGGGGGKSMFGGGPKDANMIFEFMAKGRPYILISETRSLREPLTAYAKEQGISNDQITREQFSSFFAKMDQYKSGGGSGGQKPGSNDRPSGADNRPRDLSTPPPGAAPIAPGQNPLEAISQWAEADFRRRDLNGDGVLTPEEMSDNLRSELERWDTNRDGLINIDEYKVYYSARLQMRDGAPNPPNPVTILIEEDFDRRVDVIRAGKLPKELPKWFGELDSDQDGQVALHEWLKAGKDVDEFKTWDRNDDGFITAEEVLFKQRGNGTATASSGVPAPSQSSGDRPSRGEWGSRPTGDGSTGGRPGWGGGFFKKKN